MEQATLGRRLHTEINGWEDGTILRFQERMAETGIRGTSYTTVLSYLANRTTPSVAFLREAARLFGVREAYLKDGELPRTQAEADARKEIELATDERMRANRQRGVKTFSTSLTLDLRTRDAALGLADDITTTVLDAICRFVMDVYISRGPSAFGKATEEEWNPDVALSSGEPGLDEKDITNFLSDPLSVLWGVARETPESQKVATAYALLAALYARGFDGRGT